MTPMTPEEFAKLKPEDPNYGEAEQEMFRYEQEKHAKTTEHDAATKELHETARAGMFAAARVEAAGKETEEKPTNTPETWAAEQRAASREGAKEPTE